MVVQDILWSPTRMWLSFGSLKMSRMFEGFMSRRFLRFAGFWEGGLSRCMSSSDSDVNGGVVVRLGFGMSPLALMRAVRVAGVLCCAMLVDRKPMILVGMSYMPLVIICS